VIDNGSKDHSVERIREYCEAKLKIKSKFFDYSNDNKPINFLEVERLKNKNIKNLDLNNLKHLDNKKLIIVKNGENYGFAEGNNIGIRFAFDYLKTDYILLLNNDTVIDIQLLEKMVLMSETDEKIAITQAKLLYYDEPNKINSTGNKMDIFGATHCRGCGEIDTGKYDKSYNDGFFYASGACILIKRSFISEFSGHNLFDTKLFAYHEDVDISFSAHVLGYKVVFCPEAICYHKEGSSHKNYYNKFYWAQRNNIRVLLKHYSFKYLIFIFPINLLIELLHSIFATFYIRRLDYIKIFIKSLSWNIKNINDTLEKRKIIQSKRKISDKEIIKLMEKKSIRISSNFHLLFK